MIRLTLGLLLEVQIKDFSREILGRIPPDTMASYVGTLVDFRRNELQ